MCVQHKYVCVIEFATEDRSITCISIMKLMQPSHACMHHTNKQTYKHTRQTYIIEGTYIHTS
jgi:hypothetical protein